MDSVTSQLEGVFVYIDNVLVASPSEQQHKRDLIQLFSALRRFGLVLNVNKCEFGVRELEFLGHHISAQGIWRTQEKVRAVQRFERPRKVKTLQRFLGMVNYYRRFLPNVAATMWSLTNALASAPRQLYWSGAMTTAFAETKNSSRMQPFSPTRLRLQSCASTRMPAPRKSQERFTKWSGDSRNR